MPIERRTATFNATQPERAATFSNTWLNPLNPSNVSPWHSTKFNPRCLSPPSLNPMSNSLNVTQQHSACLNLSYFPTLNPKGLNLPNVAPTFNQTRVKLIGSVECHTTTFHPTQPQKAESSSILDTSMPQAGAELNLLLNSRINVCKFDECTSSHQNSTNE